MPLVGCFSRICSIMSCCFLTTHENVVLSQQLLFVLPLLFIILPAEIPVLVVIVDERKTRNQLLPYSVCGMYLDPNSACNLILILLSLVEDDADDRFLL